MNTAIWLAAPPGATLVILDNLDWYCDVASDEDKLFYEVIVIKIEESLHFLVKNNYKECAQFLKPWPYGSWIVNYLCNQCISPRTFWVRTSIRARCTTLCGKVCQWLATGRWFSPCIPVSSTNKTDLHDKTEILLEDKVNDTFPNRWLIPHFLIFTHLKILFCDFLSSTNYENVTGPKLRKHGDTKGVIRSRKIEEKLPK